MIVVKHDSWLRRVHAGERPLNYLLPHVSCELAVLQAVPQEHHLVGLDHLHDVLLGNCRLGETQSDFHMDHMVDGPAGLGGRADVDDAVGVLVGGCHRVPGIRSAVMVDPGRAFKMENSLI